MRHPSSTQGCKHTDQSFTKKDRLLQRSDFLSATRKGRRTSTRFFLVFLRPNREGRPRLGIVVSRKVGKAVKRNYLKRRIREFFRLHKPWFPPSTDIVVVAKKGIPYISYGAVSQDLERFLRSSSLPKERRRAKEGEKVEKHAHCADKNL